MAAAWPYPRWIAHRGAGKLAPENTLAAFRLGAEHGYRMFECDAKLSADGVVFLMHDATLDRTTNGSGIGGDKPWSELAQLDAGGVALARSTRASRLPTLEALSRWCIANGHFFNIEIKPTPGAERRTGEQVAQARRALLGKAHAPPLLTSFQPDALKGALAVAPQLPRGLLIDTFVDGWFEMARLLHCAAVVCNHEPVGRRQRGARCRTPGCAASATR
jgi:glycerophosphoryl diester phosphodiesterase